MPWYCWISLVQIIQSFIILLERLMIYFKECSSLVCIVWFQRIAMPPPQRIGNSRGEGGGGGVKDPEHSRKYPYLQKVWGVYKMLVVIVEGWGFFWCSKYGNSREDGGLP